MTWNVNGFRAAIRHGFYDFLKEYTPDILGIQEIKQDTKPMIPPEFNEYKLFWNPAKKKGYAGTALFTKPTPLSVVYGMGIEEFDSEGRILTAEYDEFYLLNIYFPNAQHGLTRLDFKIAFDEALLNYAEKLRKNKPLIMMGDFNVAHTEKDIARPKENEGNAGYTKEEKEWMNKLLNKGYVDIWRHFHPNDSETYSWWSYRFNARARNIGWRVDYIVVGKEFINRVKSVEILTEVMGSDHAPIVAELDV